MIRVLSFVLVGLLLTSGFISQIGVASADSIDKNGNSKKNPEVKQFSNSVVLSSSNTTSICHIPPGNPSNSHIIVVGTSSLTAHLNHGDTLGSCNNDDSVQDLIQGNLETSSNTLTDSLEFMNTTLAQTTSDSTVGPAVSQAAQLHKLFAHEDKETKKEFQKAFLEFVKEIKKKIGKGQGPENQKSFNELGKAAIKVKSEIEKEERENEINQKIELAKVLRTEKENLREIRNEISLLKINFDTDTDEFQDLLNQEQGILTKVLISEAKANGEKLTKEKIDEIKTKTLEVKEQNNKGNSDNNSDSNENQGPDKSKNKGPDKSKNKGSDKKSNGKSKGKSK